MEAHQIRQEFLEYFEDRNHRIVDSDPLLPADDELLFTIAGMVPFKPYFLGREEPPHTRLTSSQKCLRTTDIEEVGRTDRHLTFFEMLGNFSFGDYFKSGAIDYGWEFLTDVLELDTDRLWVTVFRGTEELPRDDHSARYWREEVGVPESRILELGTRENFWAMGETGPCGPCSELHYDWESREGDPDEVQDAILRGSDRMLELWNLVFMEFQRDQSGNLDPLPEQCIDTGMGLERIASVMQGVRSPYETDLFVPLKNETLDRASLDKENLDEDQVAALRVVTDHLRSAVFLLSEGLVPGNEGRGYVLRRLIRRAVVRGRDLGFERPFLHRLSDSVVNLMGEAYPDLREQQELVRERLSREEEQFFQTLDRGMDELEKRVSKYRASDTRQVPGEEVFDLFQTYGFPVELTRELLAEEDLKFDEQEVEAAREEHRRRSRGQDDLDQVQKILDDISGQNSLKQSEFIGYETLGTEAEVTGVYRLEEDEAEMVAELEAGEEGLVQLDRTPFYPEGGGQVGDQGELGSFIVSDTREPVEGAILHIGTARQALAVGDNVRARVDRDHRRPTMRHHSATHLLQAALRTVVGDQVMQDGSHVGPERLRFDFTLDRSLKDEERTRVEELVNEWIYEELTIRAETMPFEEAEERGALAFFGEHYGDTVRVVEMGDISAEFCGGTHLGNTGELGVFTITDEASVSSGVRRIEARAGKAAYDQLRQARGKLEELTEQVGVQSPEEVPDRIESMREELTARKERIEQLRHQQSAAGAEDLAEEARSVGPADVVDEAFDNFDDDALKQTLDQVKQKLDSGVVLFLNNKQDSLNLYLGVDEGLTDQVDAGELVRELGSIAGGGGGGRPDFAQAGGSRVEALDEVRDAFWDRLETKLGTNSGD